MGGTIVVAIGGNALCPPGEPPGIATQFRHTRASLAPIVALAERGWRIAIVHGNGPQVGAALERNELAAQRGVEALPLGVLVAATAGWIGYMIQQSLQNALAARGINRQVVTLITQTECRADDPGLHRPTKPIGNVLTEERARYLSQRGTPVARDRRNRWRRLAPSPEPRAVVEGALVRDLVAEGHVVIACGGGGPPVFRDRERGWEGVEAVVDKDRAAAVLATVLDADVLLILTDVDAVYERFGTPEQRPLRAIEPADARRLLALDAFGEGSMAPKVTAALEFVARGRGRAVIAHLEQGLEALEGRSGTTIHGAGA